MDPQAILLQGFQKTHLLLQQIQLQVGLCVLTSVLVKHMPFSGTTLTCQGCLRLWASSAVKLPATGFDDVADIVIIFFI